MLLLSCSDEILPYNMCVFNSANIGSLQSRIRLCLTLTRQQGPKIQKRYVSPAHGGGDIPFCYISSLGLLCSCAVSRSERL